MKFVIAAASLLASIALDAEITRHESYRLAEILNSKGIKHWLDDGKWRGHDWNYWRDMLPYYLSKL
jgi:esterase/lipase superfamily enzyme